MKTATVASAFVPETVRVAYHDGPPAIHFAGLPWRRGVPLDVSAEKWAQMQARGDFREFDFREEPGLYPVEPSEFNNVED